MVVLAVILVSILFARRGTNEGFKTHERLMATAIVLNLVGVFLVMIPSLYLYLSTGLASSTFLALEIPHGTFGFLGLAFGIAFVFNKKPKKLKQWMLITATFWFLAFIFGLLNYLYISGFF